MDKFPNYIRVTSPLEFTRLVCALERSPRVSFLHEHEGKKVPFSTNGYAKGKSSYLLYSSGKL